jgi:hypothetical protein
VSDHAAEREAADADASGTVEAAGRFRIYVGASGIDIHLIARREPPHAEALDSSAAKES